MTESAIYAHDLTREFKGQAVVDAVSFDIQPGSVTGLLGRNGAGKTTTLRMVLGLTTPTRGWATVLGRPFALLPDAPRRVGVSMGDVGVTPGASVIGELRTCARGLGVSLRRCEDVLDLVGLEERGKKVTKLSSGMRQRFNLAAALLTEPELLILDEPATGLDPDGIRWLRDMLRTYAADGRTVLMSSHLLAEVEQTVDNVIVLQRTLRYSGSLSVLTRNGEARLEQRFFELADTSQTDVTALAAEPVFVNSVGRGN